MSRHANILIQALSLALGLMPNAVVPILFGLTYHGTVIEIIAVPALIASISAFAYDNILIKLTGGDRQMGLNGTAVPLFVPKTLIANATYLAATFHPGIDLSTAALVFLNTSVISSYCISAQFADNRKSASIAVLIAQNTTYIVIIGLIFSMKWSPAHMVYGFSAVNVVSSVISLIAIRHRWSGAHRAHFHLHQQGNHLAIGLGSSSLPFGVVSVASLYLGPESLSLLRIGTAIVQSATSLFPVNQRVLMEAASSFKVGEDALSRQVYLRGILLLIAAFAGGAIALPHIATLSLSFSAEWPILAKAYNTVVVLSPAFPLFLAASNLEKIILSIMDLRNAAVFGLLTMVLAMGASWSCLDLAGLPGEQAYLLASILVAGLAFLFLWRYILEHALIVAAIAGLVIINGVLGNVVSSPTGATVVLAIWFASGAILIPYFAKRERSALKIALTR